MYGFQIKSFNDSLNPTAQTRRSLERLAELLLRVVRLIQQQLWISQDHNKTGAGGGEMGCDWLCHAKYFTLVQHREGRGRWWQQLPQPLYLNIQTQLTFSTHWCPPLFKFISPTRN